MSRNSQGNQSFSAPPDNLNQDDWDKMISDATFYFLVADQKKALIKRSELVAACNLKNLKRPDAERAVDKAKERLAKVFGIKVVESENKAGQYFLVNLLKEDGSDESLQHLMWSDKENAQMGLTFTILALIFMHNGKISDENLFKFLKQLGVAEEDRGNKPGKGGARGDPVDTVPDEVKDLFEGDTKKFVNDILVSRQHYLNRTRVQGPDPEIEAYEYTWGERATLEIKKSDIFKMVIDLYECEPRMFKEQFDKVKEEEGEDAMDEVEGTD